MLSDPVVVERARFLIRTRNIVLSRLCCKRGRFRFRLPIQANLTLQTPEEE